MLQDMVSWNVRGRTQEQSQTLFPFLAPDILQNNLLDSFSRSSTTTFWQRVHVGLGWCLIWFQEQLTSKGVWAVHWQMLGLFCPCSVIYCSPISNCYTCPARVKSGRTKADCQTRRGFECLNIVQGGTTPGTCKPRHLQLWNLWDFTPKVCKELQCRGDNSI